MLVSALTCSAQTNVLTYHNDNARTGQNANETILTPQNVTSANFGKLGFMSVDGLVDGEPLYVSGLTVGGSQHNVLFVVTENDSVYAFDADTFAQLWHVSALGASESPSDDRGCSQVEPVIGITSTPAINLSAGPHGTIFLVAMSKDNSGNYYQRLHALDLTTGAEQSGSPVTVTATYPGTGENSSNGHVVFDPKQYKERSALLLLNGAIYTTWASHCDDEPYTGWVMTYSESTLQQTAVLNVTPNGSEGAMWNAGAGPAADSSGDVYFLDANGTFDTTLNSNGLPVSGDYGNAFIKLGLSGSQLSVLDYFTMQGTVTESQNDTDLGSGGAIVLPNFTDINGNVQLLAVGVGKDSTIYVVNRNSMGKFHSNGDVIYQEISSAVIGGAWSAPAYFNNTLYFGTVGDALKALPIANALVATSEASESSNTFSYPGTTPSISANGSSNGIVWAVASGSPSVLYAYNATNLGDQLYNSNQAGSRDQFSGIKFVTPMIVNGKVYVGTTTGVMAFGLLNGGSQLAATPTFSPVGGSTISPTQQITISDSTSGATIYYTTNGATPTVTSSEQYNGPFTLSASATVQAIAAASGYSNSAVGSANYTVSTVTANPVISPSSGAISPSQQITITDSTSGSTIYYTTNGTAPTVTSSEQYKGPFTLSASATVQAIAAAAGMSNSAVVSSSYTVSSQTGSTGAISIDFVGTATPMGSTETAGVVPETNWNDANGASSSFPLALVNSTGTPTGATVTWSSDDAWESPITDSPGNVRMMKGYLDNGNEDTTTVTVSGLPSNPNGYTVYVYAQGTGDGTNTNTGTYLISGTGITSTSVNLTYDSTFNGTFTQANNSVGNYVVFTIPNVSGFTVSAIPGTASNNFKRAPVNGIQIVPIASTNPSFTITATPSTNSVKAGSNTTYTVSVAAQNGFSGAVSLSASGLPSGATASFVPASVNTSGNSTLTVATNSTTPAGNSTITVTGTSGSLTQTATVTLTVTTSSGGGGANAISIDFVGTATAMGSTETAGVVPETNWNDANGASSSSSLALVDSTGTATGASITWHSDDGWQSPITDSPGNVRMMKGYLDNGTGDTTIVTVNGLASNANGYTVYVYAQGGISGTVSHTGIYHISGTGITTTSVDSTYNSNFNGTFTQASNSIGNYVVFTIPNVSGFTLSAIPSTASNGNERAPVNGIQIVPVGSSDPVPTITSQPTSQTIQAGQTATFTVSATGTAPLSYQWYENGTSISGATAASYTTPVTTLSENGSTFDVIVSNSAGTATSNTVTLTVTSGGTGGGNPISINFVGTDVTMGTTETAGVVAETYWNNANGANSSSPMALVDNTGTATGATVAWRSDDVWESSITDSPGNVRMMKGYLDNGNEDTTTVTVTGLPSDPNGYTVYVYAQGTSNGTTTDTGIYQISGSGITTTSVNLTYNSNFNGTFTEASNSVGNYVVFVIPNASGFTLSAIPSTASNGYKRAPVNGIQIVPR